MTPADLQAVHIVDCQAPSPWSLGQFSEELENTPGWQMVCRRRGSQVLAGFLVARAILPEVEILRLATASECQRQGVASALLGALLSLSRRQGCTRVHLELRASNLPALTLYEKFAFEVTGRRPNYYTAPQEDALCMTLATGRSSCGSSN